MTIIEGKKLYKEISDLYKQYKEEYFRLLLNNKNVSFEELIEQYKKFDNLSNLIDVEGMDYFNKYDELPKWKKDICNLTYDILKFNIHIIRKEIDKVFNKWRDEK